MKRLLFVLVNMFMVAVLFAADKEITSTRTVKEFFKSKTSMRVAVDAIDQYKSLLNDISQKVIERAAAIAKESKRSTILDRDVSQASDEVFGKTPVTVAELMVHIKQLSIVDLTELTNQVNAYGDELLAENQKKK
jgi:histone H3/H4